MKHMISDLVQDLLIQDQDQDSAVSRPRPRPRLWCPRPRLKTYKTNTGSPWLGWTVTGKVMASRKSSIPVVAHSKQQCTMFNNSSISAVTVNHCSVSNFGVYTQHFKSTMFDQQLKR